MMSIRILYWVHFQESLQNHPAVEIGAHFFLSVLSPYSPGIHMPVCNSLVLFYRPMVAVCVLYTASFSNSIGTTQT